MQQSIAELKDRFVGAFGGGGKVHVVRAPGRVNLIGEHTDYNDGFVLPMAIELEVRIVFRGRDDGRFCIASTAYPDEKDEFSVDQPINPRPTHWSNYARGVAKGLLDAGIPLVGMDALILNSLPVGSGLSSSAALLVGMAHAMLALPGLKVDPARLAMLCRKAENEFAGVPCGIMDQTICTSARAGFAMLLDCRDLTKSFVVVDPRELRVVIANTMIRHNLSDSEYTARRDDCEAAAAFFRKASPSTQSLRDVTPQHIEAAQGRLEDRLLRRARHVVTENQRTREAATLLGKRRYEEVGELMQQSHRSLRNDFDVSSPELDLLVDQAMSVRGVYGARLTGAGFSGCIVALVQPRAVESLTQQMQGAYEKQFGKKPDVYVTTASGGASFIE